MAERSEGSESRRGKTHKRRVPFGGLQYKLQVENTDPDYFYYWQKDVGDNIQRMLDAGFEYVTRREAGKNAPETLTNRDVTGGNQSLTDQVRVNGGRDEFGKYYDLVLMKQPMAWHLQDAAQKAKKADEADTAIKRQAFAGQDDTGNRYGDISVTVKSEE